MRAPPIDPALLAQWLRIEPSIGEFMEYRPGSVTIKDGAAREMDAGSWKLEAGEDPSELHIQLPASRRLRKNPGFVQGSRLEVRGSHPSLDGEVSDLLEPRTMNLEQRRFFQQPAGFQLPCLRRVYVADEAVYRRDDGRDEQPRAKGADDAWCLYASA